MPANEETGAFGASLLDLARMGRPPVVLLDALRWLSVKGGLTEPGLFSGERVERKKLHLMKALYEAGRRPLRAKAAKHSPQTVAELLLLWLSLHPEPLFPGEFMPALIASQAAPAGQAERVAAIRNFLKQTEPFIVEALYPLFEFLHHWLLNQTDREGAIQALGRLFAPPVFGHASAHGALLPEGEAGLLEDTVELMILQYRPLFTQPYNLNRYEQDAARAAEVAPAGSASAGPYASPSCSPPTACGSPSLLAGLPAFGGEALGAYGGAGPLLTPVRIGQLSVVDPGACRSPFSIAGEDFSPLPSELSADLALGLGWDEEHAELFAADPEMHSMMSALLESAVSSGLGLDHGAHGAAAANVAAALAAAAAAATEPEAELSCPSSPTAVVTLGEAGASDSSGSDGEGPAACGRRSPAAASCSPARQAALRSGKAVISVQVAARASGAQSPFGLARSSLHA